MAYLNLTALQSNMRGINAISYCSAEWQQPLILRPLQRYIFSSNLHIITFASSLFLYYLLCWGWYRQRLRPVKITDLLIFAMLDLRDEA